MRQHAESDAATFRLLQKKLKAACSTIEELAAAANITAAEVEMILDRAYREHSIDKVAAGREKVGPHPLFVARRLACPECGRRHRAAIALYSALPEDEWRGRPPADEPANWVN